MKIKIFIFVCLICFSTIGTAQAWKIVFDPSVFVQAVKDAGASVKALALEYKQTAQGFVNNIDQKYQISQDYKALLEYYKTNKQLYDQIVNQYTQIMGMYQNLKQIQLMLEDPDLTSIDKFQQMGTRVKMLGYDFKNIEHQFDQSYKLSEKALDYYILEENQKKWFRLSSDGAKHSLHAQASTEDIKKDKADLVKAIKASRKALGNLQAAQAQGEILANVAKQLMRLQGIVAAHQRVQAFEIAKKQAEQKAALAHHKKMMGGWKGFKAKLGKVVLP